MKKILSLLLAVVMMLSVSVPVFAAEMPEDTVIVKTWENAEGETVTGVITKGDVDVRDACFNPVNENEARGIVTSGLNEAAAAAINDDEDVMPLSDIAEPFTFRIYNSNNVVVSRYTVTINAKVTAFSRKITSVTFTKEYGDTCETDYSIDGNSVYVIIVHPEEGYLDGTFTLNWDGTFTVT